jgi:hypothetical protein
MAILVNATKGGISVAGGYLIITMVQMQRYLKPVTTPVQVPQEDGTITTEQRATVEPAVMYTARGQVYESASAREQRFGATDLNFAFALDHVDGKDAVQEAYEYVKKNGLQGWTLTGMTDA